MDNKSALLERSLQLFTARGYDAVGVQEIVDAVGITKPTLYHYFGSKRGLLDAVLFSNFEELRSALSSISVYDKDLPLTLQKVAELYFSFANNHPAFYRFQLALWFAPPESEGFQAVSLLNRFQYDELEKVFIAAALQHGNMRGRHQAYALTFLGMINNYISLALNGFAELNAELAFRAVHQFQHGIYS